MNAIRLILEINNASFRWYLILGILLIALDFFSGDLLTQIGLSRNAIIYFLVISAALEIFYQLNQRLKTKEKRGIILSAAVNKLRSLVLYGLGTAVIVWTFFWYQPTKTVLELLIGAGLSQPLSLLLFFLTYFFFLLVIVQPEPVAAAAEVIKETYRDKQEFVKSGRLSEKFPLRRYAHEIEFQTIVSFIKAGETVLDNGCGDGALAIMLAKKGAIVTACDISQPNISQAKIYASQENLPDEIKFLVADAENLPFADNSFDWVISSHVLEHLPDFNKGLAEVKRVTKKRAVIALPTCLNPCAVVVLGEDNFWVISKWSLFAWFVGLTRIIINLGGDGVNEDYSGRQGLPHLWRYPWVMRRDLRRGGFKIIHFEASSLCLPYFNRFLPLIKKLDKFKAAPIIRNFGYGSIAVVEKL